MLLRMPLGAYYGGHGEQVARSMRKRYGKRWKSVFYSTANKKHQRPGDDRKSTRREALKRKRGRR